MTTKLEVRGANRERVRSCLSILVLASLTIAGAARAQFVNATGAPLAVPTSSGSAWGDADGDGDMDLLTGIYVESAPGLRLFRNDRPGFTDITATAFPGATDGSGIGVTWADVDDDGDLDPFIGRINNVGVVYRNDGGTFARQTPGDLAAALASGRSSVWGDADGDGDLDIFRTSVSAAAQLLRNDGGFVFRNVTPAPLAVAGIQVAAWGDYDDDGDPDLFGGLAGGAPVLWRNDGGLSFVNAAAAAGVSASGNIWGVQWGDVDNDGHLDLVVGDIGASDRIYRNSGSGTFTNVAPALTDSTGSSTCVFDLENDGDLDIYQGTLGTGNAFLLRNDGTGGWQRLPPAGFPANHPTVGASAGDADGDGDIDLYLNGDGSSGSAFVRNDGASAGHWAEIVLEGTLSNRAGIGARVTLVAGGRSQMREVSGGDGFASQASLPLEFGLGGASSVTSVTVRWPSGVQQTVTSVGVDRVTRIVEPGFTPAGTLANGFTPGGAIDLQLDRRGVAVTLATFFYRGAGTGDPFSAATMTVGGANLAAAIPSGSASEHGVEYYVLYRIAGGTPRVFPFAGPAAPAFLPANLGTRTRPGSSPANEYELVSVPFTAPSASLAAVLEDDLGAYDPKKWRFGRFAPSGGSYLEGSAAGALTPGRGFWLIQKSPVAVDAAGTSTPTVGGVSIPVDPGWNQIGNPYLFPVAASAIDRSSAPDVTTRVVGRSGGSYFDVTTLQPWQGYWVFNGGSTTQTLVIPGLIGATAAAAPEPAGSWDWSLALDVRGAHSADLDNRAGASGVLSLAAPEPPGLPGSVRAYFVREGRGPREWTCDVRDPSADAASFDLVIDAADGDAHVSLEGMETLPSGWGAVLVSDESLVAVDPAETPEFTLPAGTVTRFRLVVGGASTLEAARSGRDVAPASLRLAAPRPNPSAAETEFAFALPSAGAVDLAVYDVSGRAVRALVHDVRGAGVHRVRWDGRSADGAPVAAGVYFAKLRTGSGERTVKVVRNR